MLTIYLQKAHFEEYVLTSRFMHSFQYPNFLLPNFYDRFQYPALSIRHPHEAQKFQIHFIIFRYWRNLFKLHIYRKDLLTRTYIHVSCESICQFHSFSVSWVAMDTDRQYCKDIIQIEI